MITLATVARLLTHLGGAVVIGNALLTFAGVGTPAARERRPAILPFAWLSLASGVALLLAAQLRALELPVDPESLRELLLGTTWGHGWLALAISVSLAALAPARGVLAIVLATAIAVASGGVGHAAADIEWPLLARVIDAAHVIGVAAWIGGLALVATAEQGTTVAIDRWTRYSALATIAAPIVVLSGVAASVRRLAGAEFSSALSSEYGRLLLAKTALALVVLAFGASHRRRVQRGERPRHAGLRAELLTALAVFLLTSVLTGTAPPGE